MNHAIVKITGLTNNSTPRRIEVDLDPGATIETVLKMLGEKYSFNLKEIQLTIPGNIKVNPKPLIVINGRAIQHMQYLKTPINDGDTVMIVNLLAGG